MTVRAHPSSRLDKRGESISLLCMQRTWSEVMSTFRVADMESSVHDEGLKFQVLVFLKASSPQELDVDGTFRALCRHLFLF